MKGQLLAQVDFNALGESLNFKYTGASIGGIISDLLPYVFVLAGLALGGFLILGGFELLTSGGDPEKIKSGQGKITSAVIGFIIIFVAYWLMQILETILGINILG